MDRFRFCTCPGNRRRTRNFTSFAWTGLREKFREIRDAGGESDFLEYLNSLRRVLKKPFPDGGQVEKYVPAGYGVREKYTELLNQVGEIPEDVTSRKELIRTAEGPKISGVQGKCGESSATRKPAGRFPSKKKPER